MLTRWMPRIFGVAAAALLLAASARAAAPLQKSQAPGYYRLMVGEFEVTVLLDGIFELKPKDFLLGTTPAHTAELLRKSFAGETLGASDNAFLINTGQELLLIDTGCGALCGAGFGRLLSNLEAAGYRPDQVDEIYLTHLHLDHVGGLLLDGKRAFPNAVVRADQRDVDHYLSQTEAAAAPADQKGGFEDAMKSLNPYLAAGKFESFTGNTELRPGIRAIAAPGHTLGHTIYAVESRGSELRLCGDLLHVAAVQFPEPAITWKNESDSKSASAQRKAAFADAAKRGTLVAAAHLGFPGIGHVQKAEKGYRFLALDYALVH